MAVAGMGGREEEEAQKEVAGTSDVAGGGMGRG